VAAKLLRESNIQRSQFVMVMGLAESLDFRLDYHRSGTCNLLFKLEPGRKEEKKTS
jgi:hypothetical protein